MSIKNLDVFFNPKRIAVIGASEDKNSIGYYVFRNLIGRGYKGVVYPVSDRYEGIQGVQAYKSIITTPHPVDLAVIATPPEQIYNVLDECGIKEVKGVIILTPNFEVRAAKPGLLESQIKNLANIYGFRVLGPNSLGYLRPGKNLNVSLFHHSLQKGNIALISQGGLFSSAFVERAVSKNVGFSYFISLGEKIDIDFSDLIDYLGIDPETRAIILYVQNIRVGRKFMAAVRSFASSKPIVVVKSGKYDPTIPNQMTHSGLLAVSDKVYDAVFKRAGAVRVDEILDLFYMTETLAKQKRPKGKRLAIVSNATGAAELATDALLKMDGQIAQPNPKTLEEIEKGLAIKRKVYNPVFLLADASPNEFEMTVKHLVKDTEVDGVMVIYLPYPSHDPKDIAEAVVNAFKTNPNMPVFTTWLGDESVLRAREYLNSKGIPTFVTPEQAVRSFIYMYRYDLNIKLLQETPEAILKDFIPDSERARHLIEKAVQDKRQMLQLHEVREILKIYGIPFVDTHIADSEDEAVKIADSVGYPVVLKIDSVKLIHKFEKGGVVLNLYDSHSVKAAFVRLRQLAIEIGDEKAKVLIQPMIITRGYELAIGAKKDQSFGTVILFGTGGEFLEALRDYAIGLPPLNQVLARRMMEETKIFKYLEGLQNYQGALRYMEEILVKFSRLIVDFHQIKEVDINPFMLSEQGGLAIDADILLDEECFKEDPRHRDSLCPPHLCIAPYPFQYIKKVTTSSGEVITIRPIRAEDEPLIYRLFKGLSDETIQFRFCQKLVDIPHEKLVRYCQIDYEREMAFVATVSDENNDETIIADVRISRMPDLENAELAILVSDEWQGKGIGAMLMEYCIQVAREIGLKGLWMEILKNNQRMLNVGMKSGFKQAYDDEDMVRVALQL